MKETVNHPILFDNAPTVSISLFAPQASPREKTSTSAVVSTPPTRSSNSTGDFDAAVLEGLDHFLAKPLFSPIESHSKSSFSLSSSLVDGPHHSSHQNMQSGFSSSRARTSQLLFDSSCSMLNEGMSSSGLSPFASEFYASSYRSPGQSPDSTGTSPLAGSSTSSHVSGTDLCWSSSESSEKKKKHKRKKMRQVRVYDVDLRTKTINLASEIASEEPGATAQSIAEAAKAAGRAIEQGADVKSALAAGSAASAAAVALSNLKAGNEPVSSTGEVEHEQDNQDGNDQDESSNITVNSSEEKSEIIKSRAGREESIYLPDVQMQKVLTPSYADKTRGSKNITCLKIPPRTMGLQTTHRHNICHDTFELHACIKFSNI